MARKQIPAVAIGEIEIEGSDKIIEVRELSLKHIYRAIDMIFSELKSRKKAENEAKKGEVKSTSMLDLIVIVEKTLVEDSTNLSYSEYENLHGAAIDALHETFREVNASFFVISSKLGLSKLFRDGYASLRGVLEGVLKQPQQ